MAASTRRLGVIGLVALVALGLGFAAYRAWPLARTDDLTSEWFSSERYEEVRAGMSQDAVRDLLGPPFSRALWGGATGVSGRREWTYPRFNFRSLFGPSVTYFEVVFDESTGRVQSTETRGGDELGGWRESLERAVRVVGDLELRGAGGSTFRLTVNDEQPTLLLCVVLDQFNDRDWTVEKVLTRRRKFVAEKQPWQLATSMPVRYCLLPRSPHLELAREFVDALPESVADVVLGEDLLGYDRAPISGAVVYKRGVLFAAPALMSGEEEFGRDDQLWLFERVLNED